MRNLFVFILISLFSLKVSAEVTNDVWTKLLQETWFAQTARATFNKSCHSENPLSATYPFTQLCPKLHRIPDLVIESAALPYLKHYLNQEQAKEAIAFWSSDEGKKLLKKIILDIQTGVYTHLDANDLETLSRTNQTEYGRALSMFAADKEQGFAVAQAMLNSKTEEEIELGIVFLCRNRQDVELRVFHSLYRTKEEAETAYYEIFSNKEKNKLQLLGVAAKGSLDEASGVIGGDLGYIKFGEFTKDFESVIFNLPLQKLSVPFVSEFGWHIAVVDEAREVGTGKICPQWPVQ